MTVKELETYLLLHEQKVEGFVKTRSRNWLIAFGIAFILFIVLVVVIFRKTKPVKIPIKTKSKPLTVLSSTNKKQSTLLTFTMKARIL
jgi:preprotein translocase subunit SecY